VVAVPVVPVGIIEVLRVHNPCLDQSLAMAVAAAVPIQLKAV
jgi:hypothetical protein